MKKSQTTYKMYLRNIEGYELAYCIGSLRHISEQLGEHYYTYIDGYFQSYHTIRRELIRAGGAYSAYYPTGAAPLLLTIIAQELEPVKYESDESIAERNRPRFEMLPSIEQRLNEITGRKQPNLEKAAVLAAASLVVPTPLEVMIDEVNAETAPAEPVYNCWVPTPKTGKKWPAYADAGTAPDAPHCDRCNVPRWSALGGFHSCMNSRCTYNLGKNWKLGRK